ncbi:MAG: peptidoglycan DD-metalloendopeptidase family protein [Balneolaceae bacterium]|nr:peptidoglycan DD-metalloendopeptidase family protein [Balneolaceae bacterium]MDR9407364.1 peptidoglycan DD-metalloendopeptidase family protein [Balneolaceae bacterium]
MPKKHLALVSLTSVIILLLIQWSHSAIHYPEKESITTQNLSEIPPAPEVDEYGMKIADIEILDDEINRNESLYIILNGQGVSPEKIHQIQQEANGIVRLNRMIPGQDYRLYRDDSGVFAFVWHRSPTEFTTINWKDEITIENGSIPIDTVVRTISGTIHSSLANSLMEQEVSQRLVVELANIYAWTVDFYALQMGDQFKAVYEDRYVNGEYIGIGKVRAAEFVHRGKELRAYYYDYGDDSGYYDPEGNSMRREMMRVPFEYNPRISSSFSRNRYHPILKRNRPHYGTDYAAPSGTPILAAGDGVVTEAQRRGGNGNIVQIKHNSVYKTAYLHMSRFARGIHAGANVEQGQVIGYVGQTGLATGPHLCYRLYKHGSPVNSVTYDFPPSEGLQDIYMDEFIMRVQRFDNMLNSVQEPDELAMN